MMDIMVLFILVGAAFFVLFLLRVSRKEMKREARQAQYFSQMRHEQNATSARARRRYEVRQREAQQREAAREEEQAARAQQAEWEGMAGFFFGKRRK